MVNVKIYAGFNYSSGWCTKPGWSPEATKKVYEKLKEEWEAEYGERVNLIFEDTSRSILDPDSKIARLKEQGKSFPLVFIGEKLIMDGGIDKKILKELIDKELA